MDSNNKIHCPKCGGYKIKKNGRFTRKRNRRKVQRYLCLACDSSFSDQTYDKTYRQKRPDLLDTVLRAVSNSMGVRRIAGDQRTTVTTVQRKIKFLHKILESFHLKHLSKWDRPTKPRFQFDELWAVESNRWQALTMPTIIEIESYFIVASRATYDWCKSSHPDIKNFYNNRHLSEIQDQKKVLQRAIKRCLLMKPKGRIVIGTDKKTTYPQIIQDVVGDRLVHERYDASDDEEKKRLFPVNNTIACMRAEKAMLRRESWYITKNKNWLNKRMALYIYYYNYVRNKKYFIGIKEVKYTDKKTGETKKKLQKEFKRQTPAMHLGIFNRPIGIEYALKYS